MSGEEEDLAALTPELLRVAVAQIGAALETEHDPRTIATLADSLVRTSDALSRVTGKEPQGGGVVEILVRRASTDGQQGRLQLLCDGCEAWLSGAMPTEDGAERLRRVVALVRELDLDRHALADYWDRWEEGFVDEGLVEGAVARVDADEVVEVPEDYGGRVPVLRRIPPRVGGPGEPEDVQGEGKGIQEGSEEEPAPEEVDERIKCRCGRWNAGNREHCWICGRDLATGKMPRRGDGGDFRGPNALESVLDIIG